MATASRKSDGQRWLIRQRELGLHWCSGKKDEEWKVKETINSYFNNTEIKLGFFIIIFMRLLCSLNFCSQVLLFFIQSSFQHKLKAALWFGHWLVWPRQVWSLPRYTCHSSYKDFSLGFFFFFFSLWVWCCNVGLMETLLHTVARETSSFFFEFCHSIHSIAVIILLKVGRGSHEEVPVTDVRAGIDQTLWLESHQGSQGQQRGFCRCWRGVGSKTASTWIWIMCWEPPPIMPAAMSQVQAYMSEMLG